jgi:hypothetical protein
VAIKETTSSTAARGEDMQSFLNWGQERTEAALALQKELLAAYEEASRAWLARVQSEVALWSDLASKMTATRTVPQALETYSQCVSQRMKMAADDGRLMADEAQKVVQKITKSLGNGWPGGSA